jgi:hypothetical protein
MPVARDSTKFPEEPKVIFCASISGYEMLRITVNGIVDRASGNFELNQKERGT